VATPRPSGRNRRSYQLRAEQRRVVGQRHRYSGRGRALRRPRRHWRYRMNSLQLSGAVLALDGAQPLQRELVGGKAYSLNQMRRLGLPVPPAFVLATSMCATYQDNGGELPDGVWDAVLEQLSRLEG